MSARTAVRTAGPKRVAESGRLAAPPAVGGSDRVPRRVPGGGPGGVLNRAAAGAPFQVHLEIFQGPFEVLLALIGKHQLDVTEIALAEVTDEFIVHIRRLQEERADWDLGQASEFLLVAATLLDLKASRLLPRTGLEDEDDLALIEARDLLFARLLQYRAFKDIAAGFAVQMEQAGAYVARQAGLEPHFAALMPELVMGITPEQLAAVAARALTPKAPAQVGVEHLHVPTVSVREQAELVASQLRREGSSTFRALVAGASTTLVIVARFLALLELFRESLVVFEQQEALAELTVSWVGAPDTPVPPALGSALDGGSDGGVESRQGVQPGDAT